MDRRVGAGMPARPMQARRRPRIGGLGLGRHEGDAGRRKLRRMFGRDETGPRRGVRKVGQVASIREEGDRSGTGPDQRRRATDRPFGALRRLRPCDRRQFAGGDGAEIFVETRIGHGPSRQDRTGHGPAHPPVRGPMLSRSGPGDRPAEAQPAALVGDLTGSGPEPPDGRPRPARPLAGPAARDRRRKW